MALEVLLTCCPPGPLERIGLLLQVLVANFDLDVVGDFGRDVDRGETRLPLAFGVEGADPHEAVNAVLALEIAVGHRAADGDRGAVDAGHFVVLAVQQFGRVVVIAGPGRVHPQEHLGPVVGVGAAVAGVDRQQGRIVVQRAVQERLRLQVVEHLLQPLDLAGHFGGHAFVFRGHFDHRGQIIGGADGLFQRLDDVLQPLELADDLLGLLAIIPEIALAHLLFDGRDLPLFALEVKESP